MNPAVLKNGIYALFGADTPNGLADTLTGGLWRGSGKPSASASMPYGVLDLGSFRRNDTMGSTDEVQFQEGIVQITFWSKTTSDEEIDTIQGLAGDLYDWCRTDDQNTITVTGWTVTQFTPGPVTPLVNPDHPDKYQLVMEWDVMLQKQN